MTLAAFDGAAGSGKTFSVFQELEKELQARPLLAHHRVLALTFMHGARHRLDRQLDDMKGLKGRYEATTLDSFVWRICRRWRSRLLELAHQIPSDDDYETNCALAAVLLGSADVRAWVASAFPIIIIDEAQDLDAGRLRIVEELTKVCSVLLAFDDFQCLNSSNRPVAITMWIKGRCTPTTLSGNQRTNRPHLITAALQIRSGQPLTASGASFKWRVAPARRNALPMLAATTIANEIVKGGSFAILTPSGGGFAQGIVEALRTQTFRNGAIGPFSITWEGADEERAKEVVKKIQATPTYALADISTLLATFSDVPSCGATLATLKRMHDAKGIAAFPAAVVAEVFQRQEATAKRFNRGAPGGRRAMTIHRAKNREFDRVALIWPYKMRTDPDDRRRLFYNAVTRARESCIVIVQSQKLLALAPFV